MADIFISYAREDHDTAYSLARAFEAEGWSTFWDRKIPPGERFDVFIEKNLREARCIIVLWSKASSQSDWTLDEADYGRAKQTLVPALIDDTKPPLGFRRIQAANLIGWQGEVNHSGYRQLVHIINERITNSPPSNGGILLSTVTIQKKTTQEVEKPLSSTIDDEPSYIKEVQYFIAQWFQNMDNHAFAETFFPMISTEDFEIILPEGTVSGMSGFQEWYEGVTRIFFNESHIVRDVRLSLSDNRIVANVVLTWQAERWASPEPKSQRIGYDANLKLEIGRSLTGTPIMLRYVVEELRPLPGSPAL